MWTTHKYCFIVRECRFSRFSDFPRVCARCYDIRMIDGKIMQVARTTRSLAERDICDHLLASVAIKTKDNLLSFT